jgi:hypothetical protein
MTYPPSDPEIRAGLVNNAPQRMPRSPWSHLCGKAAPGRPPRSEQVIDPGRFPDLRVVTLPGLPAAHRRSSGISDRLSAHSCGGSSGFGTTAKCRSRLTGFPFNRGFPRHLNRGERSIVTKWKSTTPRVKCVHEEYELDRRQGPSSARTSRPRAVPHLPVMHFEANISTLRCACSHGVGTMPVDAWWQKKLSYQGVGQSGERT